MTGTTPVAGCAVEGCSEPIEFPDGEGEHCILHIPAANAQHSETDE